MSYLQFSFVLQHAIVAAASYCKLEAAPMLDVALCSLTLGARQTYKQQLKSDLRLQVHVQMAECLIAWMNDYR